MEMSYTAPAVPFVATPVEHNKRRKAAKLNIPMPPPPSPPPTPPPTPEPVSVPVLLPLAVTTVPPSVHAPMFVSAKSMAVANSPTQVISYRFGFERFVYLVQLADGRVKVCFGGMLEHPGLSISLKNIDLSIEQCRYMLISRLFLRFHLISGIRLSQTLCQAK